MMESQYQERPNDASPHNRLDEELDMPELESSNDSSNPVSLDGCLYCRRGRSSGNGSMRLKRRFVSLSLSDGGSIKVFKDIPSHLQQTASTSVLQTVYSKVHRSLSYAVVMKRMENLDMYIPSDLPWCAKDVENDSANFVVEIPSTASTLGLLDALLEQSEGADNMSIDDAASGTLVNEQERETCVDTLREEVNSARNKGRPLRVYFRCSTGSHEKALWLRAFSKVGRLSTEYWKKKKPLLHFLSVKAQTRVRTRRESHQMLAQDVRHLDLSDEHYEEQQLDLTLTNDVEKLIRGPNSRFLRDREYRVLPTYAYPHRWMTRSEMNEEMGLPSERFHDLRVKGCPDKEIGSLRVEVLQCLGLPKLDRTSDTDATVYLVCGSYAFATDIIPNRMNPVWLRKSRRACDFPLFHGYARLYVGVFDDDGKREKDDFAGRVVIDLARLRPRSTYDVTLPLRLSTHVYSRRKRGAIRLRFTLNWNTERDALMSYIPKKIRIPLPQHSKPNFKTTVNCSDEKAFRNIAITVHGAHMPGRFTFHQMRSSIRELNFTRKYIFLAIRQAFRETRHWHNPAMSALVFLAWMHCVYMNAFSLAPAYLSLCFLLFLMRSYAKYGIKVPEETGFIPPSWEEMCMAVVRGGDSDYHAIEPLDLGHRPAAQARRLDCLSTATGVIGERDMKAETHKPWGTALLRFLGFLDSTDPAEGGGHLEFPFGNETDYPKFGTKECLVDHKGERRGEKDDSGHDDESNNDLATMEKRIMPRFPLDMPQFPIDMPDIMRKDSSGLKEYDEEENNFTAGRAVVAQGKKAAKTVTKTGKKAAGKLSSAATKTGTKLSTAAAELTEMTGLNHVVAPVRSGITASSAYVSSSVNQVQKGVSHGVNQVQKGVSHGVTQIIQAPLNYSPRPGLVRRGHSADDAGLHRQAVARHRTYSIDDHGVKRRVDDPHRLLSKRPHIRRSYSNDGSLSLASRSIPASTVSAPPRAEGRYEVASTYSTTSSDFNLDDLYEDEESKSNATEEEEEVDPALLWPEQNIDIEGPATGKKLTDDLVDIKDKVHELTWHLFDDHAYVVKKDAVYFGELKKPEKRRKDARKKLNKLLNVGSYSHSNPFVARVGLYVDPIIGSVYSFLCLFRAGFNVLTWQDPMLTFWLSVATLVITVVLFFFPWRLFLFVSGCWFVGPQNWLIRILRERGHLPPLQKKPHVVDTSDEEDNTVEGQFVFTENRRRQGNEIPEETDFDIREVHRVVVPCTPLMYQRFYDWPPEPLFAQVKPDASEEARRRRALMSLQRVARRPQRRPSLLMRLQGNHQRGPTSSAAADTRANRPRGRRQRKHAKTS